MTQIMLGEPFTFAKPETTCCLKTTVLKDMSWTACHHLGWSDWDIRWAMDYFNQGCFFGEKISPVTKHKSRQLPMAHLSSHLYNIFINIYIYNTYIYISDWDANVSSHLYSIFNKNLGIASWTHLCTQPSFHRNRCCRHGAGFSGPGVCSFALLGGSHLVSV